MQSVQLLSKVRKYLLQWLEELDMQLNSSTGKLQVEWKPHSGVWAYQQWLKLVPGFLTRALQLNFLENFGKLGKVGMLGNVVLSLGMFLIDYVALCPH